MFILVGLGLLHARRTDAADELLGVHTVHAQEVAA
jgi:hypothetical protein